MVEEPSNKLRYVAKVTALVVAFTSALWLEIEMLFSVRVAVFACDHCLLLEALHVLLLASCVAFSRAFPERINQIRLTLVVAFGAPVVLWVAVRGWAPSYVGINLGPSVAYWKLLHCAIAAAFLLIALCLPRREKPAEAGSSASVPRGEPAD